MKSEEKSLIQSIAEALTEITSKEIQSKKLKKAINESAKDLAKKVRKAKKKHEKAESRLAKKQEEAEKKEAKKAHKANKKLKKEDPVVWKPQEVEVE